MDFDPTTISYMDLLHLFWQSHNPKRKAWSRQYKAIVLYHDDSQYEQAQLSKTEIIRASKESVTTDILPLTKFYLAENYHQKYRLQMTPLMEEVTMTYPNSRDWINSTAAARLNGYLSGYGIAETFATDIKQLGLSENGEHFLQQSIANQRAPLTCPLP